MFKIHEGTSAEGLLSAVFLRVDAGVLAIVENDRTLALPEQALPAVMARYGAPFDEQARIVRIAKLELGEGSALHHVRHLAGYDVIARDYLLYEAEGKEASCALATTVAGALIHIAHAAAQTAK